MFPAPQVISEAVSTETNQVNRVLTRSAESNASEATWARGYSDGEEPAIVIQRFRPGLKRPRKHECASSTNEDKNVWLP
jgi:hypothetical protein